MDSKINIYSLYKKNNRYKFILMYILFLLIIVFFLLSLFIGSSQLSFIEVIKGFFHIGDETNILIVYSIRLPRVLGALICGGGLAISGCIMQNVLGNPMASPSTLGVSNACVFGANIAIILLGAGSLASNNLININNPYLVSLFSFCFALVAVFIILGLSKIKKFSNETIILSGVAIGTIFEAGTTLIQFFAVDNQISSAVFWTFGNLGRLTYTEIIILSIVIFVSFVYFYLKRIDYNVLANGYNQATSLGVNVKSLTIISLFLASLITACSVSFVGIIGFVGLISPQIIKRLVGDDFRHLMPLSFLCGSLLLLIADILARIVVFGTSLPVGAITSLVGGPLFIILILQKRNNKHELIS